jgi:hypothetical protein
VKTETERLVKRRGLLKIWAELRMEDHVNFTLEQATKAQRGSRGIAVLFPLPRR